VRIAYLCNSPIPSNVASGIQVMKMCQALAQVGNDVTLFCPRMKDASTWTADIHGFYGVQPSFNIKRLPRPGSWTDRILPASRLFRWQMSLRQFDLIFAVCNSWRPYRLHMVKGHPMILEAHLLRRARPVKKLLRRPWLRGLVIVSEGLRREYLDTYNLEGIDVLVACNAADPAKPCSPAQLPGSNAVRCGYVGNLYNGRGVEIIVPLARRCPEVHFHIFGGTAEQIAGWREKTGAANIPNLWFHGSLPPADTDAARLACDLLIAPYEQVVQGVGNTGNLVRWMSPMKIFEYMAAGKAILASDLPTVREVLRDRENAVLVPPDDIEAWAEAVRGLAADPDERRRLGARAQKDFVEQHTWQARAHRIMDAFAPTDAKAGSPDRARQHSVQRTMR
jgi:glycosyltransferase involved in cell wall biosynthesis